MQNNNHKYPFWPPVYPRIGDAIIALQVRHIIEDLAVNQIPHGDETDVPVLQKLYPRQAQALQPTNDQNPQVGYYGSNLYDLFMAPYNAQTVKK